MSIDLNLVDTLLAEHGKRISQNAAKNVNVSWMN